ncbi:MAG TPA: hypothetical protein VJA86_04135 [Candidatus Nanoarchaeia archaeon]|nr:hypothetical protein [Candidatus Nanoarchaeia archaeon]
MEQKKLTIIVGGDIYDFAMHIKNPELIKRYSDKPGEVTNYLRANIAEAIADLYAPAELKEQMGDMNLENINKKRKLIEEKSNNSKTTRF